MRGVFMFCVCQAFLGGPREGDKPTTSGDRGPQRARPLMGYMAASRASQDWLEAWHSPSTSTKPTIEPASNCGSASHGNQRLKYHLLRQRPPGSWDRPSKRLGLGKEISDP